VSAPARWASVLVAALLLVALVGGALVLRTHRDRADALVRQERYAAVLAAADREVTAFVNLRYDRASQTVAAVAAGATGDFRDHYVTSADQVERVLRQQRSSMTGHVVWSGVVDIAADRATVIAATTGTVTNAHTGNIPDPRHYRLRVSLVRVGERWLVSDLRFVGAS
jgi:Mce-associated membrane protein